MKKVSFIITDMSAGGAERVMSLIANYLVQNEIEVQIIAIKSGRREYKLDERIQFIHIKRNKYLLARFIDRIHLIKYYTKDADAVISFLWHCNVYTILALLLTHKRVIISERSDPDKEMSGKYQYFKWFRNLCYRRADHIVFQTENAMNYYQNNKCLYSKGVIIQNPIMPNMPESVEYEHRENKIVMVGRLNYEKNVVMGIKGFAQVNQEFDNKYRLEIYGDGDLKNELERFVKLNKLSGYVSFKGFEKNVIEKIRTAKLFYNTSLFEGVSNSIIEALALGIPVIATDCPIGGTKMIIKPGFNGELVTIGDNEELVKKSLKVLKDGEYWKELSSNALLIKKELSIDSIGKKWVSLLDGK